jgi:hypothetical protein
VSAQPQHSAPQALLDPSRLHSERTHVQDSPFAFLIATEQLPTAALPTLRADFPRYTGAGFFPHDPADCGESVNALVRDLSTGAFADAVGTRLGVPDLGTKPALVTLCRSLNRRHGTVHTDSQSKVVTALLYLNAEWPHAGPGCLRFLHQQDDIDSLVVPEIKPLYGTITAFRRADNSWHGHLPFEGERLVIQVAWLTSEDEKRRKTRRGRVSRAVKWLLGKLDARWRARD